LLKVLEHPTDSPLVILAVETEAAFGATGRQDPVPTLPRAEDLRRDSDAAAQLSDSHRPAISIVSTHVTSVQTLYKPLTDIRSMCTFLGQSLYKGVSE
jgi:hypothetical protein